MSSHEQNPFYFRQLLSGQDFAIGDPMATNMVNFSYLVGDRRSGQCLVVDPAYAIEDIRAIAHSDNMTITGALVSHYHADHIGGSMMGHTIEGITKLLELDDVPIHVNKMEAPWIERTTGVDTEQLCLHDSHDVVTVGDIDITLLHTPGHTPGSQCFLVHNCLISGDTLFLDGCGRTDLPGSDVEQMYASLTSLQSLADETVLLPGHRYSEMPAAYLGDVKKSNYVFKPKTKEAWMMMFGGH
jgi:glyoxylase-like metal-dependent hydrolase (beta-lactamase superfamily II)